MLFSTTSDGKLCGTSASSPVPFEKRLGMRLDLITWAAVWCDNELYYIFYSAFEAPCPAYRLVADSISSFITEYIEVYCTDDII